jgi:hypothetical protein
MQSGRGVSPSKSTPEAHSPVWFPDANEVLRVAATPEADSTSTPHPIQIDPRQVVQATATVGDSILVLKNAYKASRQARKTMPQKVFGVPLRVSIRYASIELIQYPTSAGKFINGLIPVVVTRRCEMIRKSKI